MHPRALPHRRLEDDLALLEEILDDTIGEQEGADALALVTGLRAASVELRRGTLPGGRDAFAARLAALEVEELGRVARAFTLGFHLVNAAEEQHRIRVLRERDRPGAPPEGSIAAACARLHAAGAAAPELRALLGRLFVMPVLTAHPTEARRRTALDHLAEIVHSLDHLDDPRPGSRERARQVEALRAAVGALLTTEEARTDRPSPIDEIRVTLQTFERTLLDVTPAIYRELEDTLARCYPAEAFEIGPFLRWGTWVGGDRDGNPGVDAEVTRAALERHRTLALTRHLADVEALLRVLSPSARRVAHPRGLARLEADLAAERARLPDVAARARRVSSIEPWREKLWYVRARLQATVARAGSAYPDAAAHVADLALLVDTLAACGLERLARGRLRDAWRRAQVFGFHLATLDLRQHSAVHEVAVDELLARGGVTGYLDRPEGERVSLLASLLERAAPPRPDRAALSAATRDLLATLEVVGRARRDQGPEACERYVVSFTRGVSDLLEVLFLARAARLAPDELRPIPLLEQVEDLARAREIAERMLEVRPLASALGGELEVMVGYSDSGKQVGYVPSQIALRDAQEALADVAAARAQTLTVFHGRGGAVGRGGGPASRAIRAQPARALGGRLRLTEQGETIAARYGRPEIARRDLEQMVSAVLVASLPHPAAGDAGAPDADRRGETLARAAGAARAAYDALLADPDRLARYAVAATPIHEIAELPIASRPAARRPGLSLADLRAIPWVFSWNQSRHGVPGWYGLGAALDAVAAGEGPARARSLYDAWPFFRALIDNAQLALARADVEVAEQYARLADPGARGLFELIRAEHARTVARILEATGEGELLAGWPTIARTVARRNPSVDVLSHCQIELLRRLRAAPETSPERARCRELLFVTISGIAAGLQTAG